MDLTTAAAPQCRALLLLFFFSFPQSWAGAVDYSANHGHCSEANASRHTVMTKNLFNPQFGSIFRTCHNPTYFSRRLSRFSDIYMASLSCLLNYDPSYTFYPRRTPLQHEAPLWMDQLCTGCMKTPHQDDMASIR
ncbi:5'-nucleotidase domain-containing protein 2 [Ataeniobius toweri]|uniref:5'-nucleotidase domain-containing protein 2 n=1 Tax=Ataeniobius toweri TaxID=208326 RepID=A0ABU7CDI6_9TELE|nr:5'-nucleotidase domain-containing protein 2 [Ataeniobius toweri]